MTTSSPPTIDVVAPHPFAAQIKTTRVLDHKRRGVASVGQRGRALDVIGDLGALLLTVWLMPFVILASPILLILWAVLALIHRL